MREKSPTEDDQEEERCLCPSCGFDVDKEATQCSECGEYFPALSDRKALCTSDSFDAFRWVVLAIAIAIGAVAVVGLLIRFVLP
jgi:hypothetical protein